MSFFAELQVTPRHFCQKMVGLV